MLTTEVVFKLLQSNLGKCYHSPHTPELLPSTENLVETGKVMSCQMTTTIKRALSQQRAKVVILL